MDLKVTGGPATAHQSPRFNFTMARVPRGTGRICADVVAGLSEAINPARRSLRIELGVPVQIIEPAIVQVVRRKQPAVAVELMHRRRERVLPRKHPRLL